jgi:hypothetical protein
VASKNLFAIVTMLILMGGSAHAQQELTMQELLTMEKLIESGDWRALYTYVRMNPNLTAGTGALAVELRSFVSEVERGQLNRFYTFSDDQSLQGTTSQPGLESRIY